MNDRNLLEYAKALSKRRKGGAWPCSSRSILEPEERQTLLALLRRIDRRSTAIYAATQLRGLVDLPEALPARDKQHWSRSVVSFALIDIDSRTWSVRLVVVAADANADLLRMLQDAGVPHVQMVAGVTPELQASLILEHADAQSRLQSLRGSSHSQRLIAQQIREALCLLPSVHVSQVADEDLTLSDKEMRDHLVSDVEAENWVLLEEVGLQRLVEFPGCQDKAIREFICRSSVDAVLVSTQGEEARPILVIEFDGPHHDHLNARKRDQVKDALLADAKIPLLRVSHLDVNIKHWRRASSEERHDMSGYLRPMQQLVRRLVGESEALRRYMGERQRCMGWELEDVEKPFVAQLQALGWRMSKAASTTPRVTGRTSFTEVIQEAVLRRSCTR
jgi:very-short-patch-repair endonuclease